eukprot:jgi/Galph1/5357/GphlegSOOS_G3995.1
MLESQTVQNFVRPQRKDSKTFCNVVEELSIYEKLKVLCDSFSPQSVSHSVFRFYDVFLNLNGSFDLGAENKREVAERISEVIFILDTLDIASSETKRLEKLCDKLIQTNEVAEVILLFLLELANYDRIQVRQRESSIQRFFVRKSQRDTSTENKDRLLPLSHDSRSSVELKDITKTLWKYKMKQKKQVDVYSEKWVVQGKSWAENNPEQQSGILEVEQQQLIDHSSSDFMKPSADNLKTSFSTIPSPEKSIDGKDANDMTPNATLKSIFDFTEETYMALYRKHFGSNSTNWIPAYKFAVFEAARWALIGNVSYLIRKSPHGGLETMAARLQPNARKLLGEFVNIGNNLIQVERIIQLLHKYSNLLFLGMADGLEYELDLYGLNILPLFKGTNVKFSNSSVRNYPVFSLLQRVELARRSLSSCVQLLKMLLKENRLEPRRVFLKLYNIAKVHYSLNERDHVSCRLFFRIFFLHLSYLRRKAVYGSHISDGSNSNSTGPCVEVSELLETVLPHDIKFMVDKTAEAVNTLRKENPHHPFLLSNRESLCLIPEMGSWDVDFIIEKTEEYFTKVSEAVHLQESREGVTTKDGDQYEVAKAASAVAKLRNEEQSGGSGGSQKFQNPEKSCIPSVETDITKYKPISKDNTCVSSFDKENKHGISQSEENRQGNFQLPPWIAAKRHQMIDLEHINIPFDKFIADLGLANIQKIYKYIQRYLWFFIQKRFKIFEHFHAIKDYLLLNRGDLFFEICMSLYDFEIDDSYFVGTELEAKMMSTFEQAVLTSSAINDEKIRDFHSCLVRDSSTHMKENIYSVFCLQWKPLNQVQALLFDSTTSDIYSRLFRFAFNLKAASQVLRHFYLLIFAFPQGWNLQRPAQLLRFQLVQFINGLQQFYEYGLLQKHWSIFMNEARHCDDVWQVRNRHLSFLNNAMVYAFQHESCISFGMSVNSIIHKIFLVENKTRLALMEPQAEEPQDLRDSFETLHGMLQNFYNELQMSPQNVSLLETDELFPFLLHLGLLKK